MPLISVHSLTYSYLESLEPALRSISFDCADGEYLAIVGANGSGKSTLARCLNGLVQPPAGTVSIAGLDPSTRESLRDVRRTVSLVFQSPPDQIVASVVEEDIAFGLENLGTPREVMLERVDEALRVTGLVSERSRPTRFLSAGQQQRLAVAGVIAMKPRCMVFDEATSMIDPPGRADILMLMDELNKNGTAIIHITHDMEEAARARRVIVLDRGRIAFEGSPEELFSCGSLESFSLLMPLSTQAACMFGLPVIPGESPAAFGARLARQPAALFDHDGMSRYADLKASVNAIPDCAFRFDDVSLRYLRGHSQERLAVDKVSMSVPEGSIVALVGATGSGKSTMLQLMAALLFPDSGTVFHFGKDSTGIGSDPQAMRIRSPLSVQRPESAIFEYYAGDEVAFGPRNKGLKGAALVARVKSAMDSVALPYDEFRDRRARSLSGGEKRRLAIASVLSMDSEALLLDEPASALDPASKRSIMDLLFSFAKSDGNKEKAHHRTLVFATHSMEEAARADFVAVVGDGRLLAWGPPAHIFGPGWSASWGIGRTFAAEAVEAARLGGLCLPDGIIDLEGLKSSLVGAVP